MSIRAAGNDTEAQRVLGCVTRWLEIREREGYQSSPGDAQMRADIWHSALLQRLLMGIEPLEKPPPLAHSYPWYSLIETGKGQAMYAGEMDWAPGKLAIDGGGPWTIIERLDPGWLVECDRNGQRFRVTPGKIEGFSVKSGKREPIYTDGWDLERVESC